MRSINSQLPINDLEGYVLLADAPPLEEGGHGGHILAWNWIESVGAGLKLVVTRRFNGRLSKAEIERNLQVPTLFYPDLSGVWFPHSLLPLKWFFETLAATAWLPKISNAIKACAGRRLFAFVGNNIAPLLFADMVRRWTGLPLDVYLVDDLEESARVGHHRLVARFTRWLEPRILRRADRVFVISHGYVEHLQAKYRITSEWLPIPFRIHTVDYHAYRPAIPDIRRLTFLGGVNPLYLGALRELLQLIGEWNRENNPFQLRLLIMTYSDPGYVERELGPAPELEILFCASNEECRRRMRESWAVFLANSFAEEVRAMVSTSFPSKLAEALPAGRPLLVFGPAYAALPRYFRENQLPICVTSPKLLKAALQEIEQFDTVWLIQQYQLLIDRHHSVEKLKQLLAGLNRPSSGSMPQFARPPGTV